MRRVSLFVVLYNVVVVGRGEGGGWLEGGGWRGVPCVRVAEVLI